MKGTIPVSLLIHALFFAALVVVGPESQPRRKGPIVYHVQLVSLPEVREQAAMVTAAQSPPTSIKKPEVPTAKIPQKAAKLPRREEKKEPQGQKSMETKEVIGTPSRGVHVDIKDFPFTYYLILIRYRTQENWRPPYQVGGQKERMSATVRFRILRNGSIVDVVLEKSSGRFMFDQAALRAALSASPLPPLPEEFGSDDLAVHIEFEGIW